MRVLNRGARRRAGVCCSMAAMLTCFMGWAACSGAGGGDDDPSRAPGSTSHGRLCAIGYESDCTSCGGARTICVGGYKEECDGPTESWTGAECCLD